ncbi:hypothetical protein AYI68_g7198 [Smittium mucronatum]|uniref:Uncharacterized protein n=1 Tax=Smittium mucronatum TaxID=133383 RepID=A0A1R0GPF2_9FUNG|nr:hypothetical protein AYI68_g7198 [Smittium mucronatum]
MTDLFNESMRNELAHFGEEKYENLCSSIHYMQICGLEQVMLNEHLQVRLTKVFSSIAAKGLQIPLTYLQPFATGYYTGWYGRLQPSPPHS